MFASGAGDGRPASCAYASASELTCTMKSDFQVGGAQIVRWKASLMSEILLNVDNGRH